MKTLQQLKFLSPSYKRALLLLFFVVTVTFRAQSFYFVKGTQIMIDENAILFVKDSGKINQIRLKFFEGKIITQKQTLDKKKRIVFKGKSTKILSKKNEKDLTAKSFKEKLKNYPKIELVEFAKIFPDNHFSTNQKGLAISASITIQYNFKFLIENVRLKAIHNYFINVNNEKTIDGLIFFKDYQLSLSMTRPPPFEFYFQKKYI